MLAFIVGKLPATNSNRACVAEQHFKFYPKRKNEPINDKEFIYLKKYKYYFQI